MDRISKVFAGAGSGSMRARAWWRALRGQPNSAAGHWALRDVSLHVKPGESVGLIGDNGAGKSTLLKILAGVLRPSSGSVTSSGTLAPLLELGAGFNPDFSGRENLKLGAALMGVRAAQLKRHLPAIEAFAELGEHLDRPLKHYSSGMVMRLGFALASTLKPDLLITDEVLAVGDESFQRKCNRWVDGYVAEGGTLLLVSHSMDQIRRLCRRTYWLKDGRVEMEGDTDQVVDAYLADHASRGVLEPDADYSGAHYRLTELEINTVDGQLMDADELVISAQIHSPDNRPPVVALGIKDRHNTPVYGLTSEMDQVQPQNLGNRRYGFKLKVDVGKLLPGPYQVTGHAMDPEALRLFDTAIRHFVIAGDAVNTDCDGGFIRL